MGLLFRDGVAVVLGLVLGLVTAALALYVGVGLMPMAWVWGSE